MLKKLLATSVLAAVSTSAFAGAEIYGKVNVSLQSSDGGDGAITELKSNSSRFGLQGSEKLESGLTLIYKYEMQIDVSDESGEKNLKSRNQYVGIKGGFGELVLGRNDTVLKQSQGKFDIFSDYEGDIKNLGWQGENRMSDSVTYKTPKFSGVQFGVSYILDEENDDSAVSLSAVYGDKALKKGKYYAAVAYDSEVKGYDTARLTIGTKVSDVKVGVILQSQENVETGADASGVMVNGQYKVGAYNLKAQYQTLEDDSGLSLGADRKLGENTKAYAFYTTFTPDMGEDESDLALGLEHKF